MRIFLDSANPEEIRQGIESGLISGVTTNPSLLGKASDPYETMQTICALVPGPVSLQVVAHQADEMVEQGKYLANIASNVVVKLPLTPEGLKACHRLRSEDIDVNVTLCFSVAQGLLAARAGATYVSPFIGRLEDAGGSGEALIYELSSLFAFHDLSTKILAASIRHPSHFEMAAACGAHVATLPFSVFQDLYSHDLSKQGLKKFDQDAQGLKAFFAKTNL